ncbi:uncharacterized protein G2W53_044974 [Senna tora]|uniref:Uncharacterized protein n=1 Tax=Senna tora TaxID=362788 RepID=A0A834SBM0_9FABA|nr:uncharacterized protein G2W53_044974 [Senna tora]
MGGAWIMCLHIPDDKSRSDLRNLHKLRGKRLVAQVSQTRGSRCIREPEWFDAPMESSWHGRSVDHVLTYPDDKSRSDLRNLHELRGKRLVAQGGAWIVSNIFRTTNRGRISETFTNYEAKDLLRK